jgi:hypothetical protein
MGQMVQRAESIKYWSRSARTQAHTRNQAGCECRATRAALARHGRAPPIGRARKNESCSRRARTVLFYPLFLLVMHEQVKQETLYPNIINLHHWHRSNGGAVF